jgi:uncharacterized protein YcfJ
VVEKTRVVHAAPKQVHYEQRRYAEPAPAQPNYVGIGTGAVIGGLIGNQIGGGNGKKLATAACWATRLPTATVKHATTARLPMAAS